MSQESEIEELEVVLGRVEEALSNFEQAFTSPTVKPKAVSGIRQAVDGMFTSLVRLQDRLAGK